MGTSQFTRPEKDAERKEGGSQGKARQVRNGGNNMKDRKVYQSIWIFYVNVIRESIEKSNSNNNSANVPSHSSQPQTDDLKTRDDIASLHIMFSKYI